MTHEDHEDLKLKAEIDEIMRRVDRILAKISSADPGKNPEEDTSGD